MLLFSLPKSIIEPEPQIKRRQILLTFELITAIIKQNEERQRVIPA